MSLRQVLYNGCRTGLEIFAVFAGTRAMPLSRLLSILPLTLSRSKRIFFGVEEVVPLRIKMVPLSRIFVSFYICQSVEYTDNLAAKKTTASVFPARAVHLHRVLILL
eukprot:IDg11787t1